jgi:PPOX class probable F420-dependent enzyme
MGTNRVNGPPHLSSVWYLHEAGRIYVSIGAHSVKMKNLKQDPQVSICVDGCYPDYRTVTIHGVAELHSENSPFTLKMRLKIFRRYHETEEEARSYFDSIKHLPSVLVVVTPQKTVGIDYN